MLARGIAEEDIAKYDLAEWIGGFDDEEENVKNVVEKIKNHPNVLINITVNPIRSQNFF